MKIKNFNVSFDTNAPCSASVKVVVATVLHAMAHKLADEFSDTQKLEEAVLENLERQPELYITTFSPEEVRQAVRCCMVSIQAEEEETA